MMIVLTSFTPSTAPGGVPRWCRDFMSAFPEGQTVHYSWPDLVKSVGRDSPMPEWDKAGALVGWLRSERKLKPDDILVGDGFWADVDGMHSAGRTLSVCHGNWSHTTRDDVEMGVPPEFPHHHRVQLAHRLRMRERGVRMVAVSEFIAHQCEVQWGLLMPVIENGIDLQKFLPRGSRIPRRDPDRPVVVHGVTNQNKGQDHIRLLERRLDAHVVLLDDAARHFNSLQSERRLTKYQALSHADAVVVPSAHEGNSYFVLESLACDVPVVCYDVGLMFTAYCESAGGVHPVGRVLRKADGHSPERTLEETGKFLADGYDCRPREWVMQYSLENFQRRWRDYMKAEFSHGS